jgi:hypothetical protein
VPIAKGTRRAPKARNLRGACTPWKLLNLISLKCCLLDFGGRLYTILMVRKQHYKIKIYIFLGKKYNFTGGYGFMKKQDMGNG